tara:strand:- start:3026 stop:3721 length:696 start_codon:yes stop_codon:yes gene_type:complete
MEREIISLGKNCFTANLLRRMGIIKEKDILDGMATGSLRSLCELLENKFANFFLWDNLQFYGKSNNGRNWTVFDTATTFRSGHDFRLSKPKEESYVKFQKKIDPDMLYKRIAETENPIFLRINSAATSIEDTMRLHDVIVNLRNQERFTLLIFQDSEVSKDWGLETLKMYRVPEPIYKGIVKLSDARYTWKTFAGGWTASNGFDFTHWSCLINQIFLELGVGRKVTTCKFL